MKDKIEKRLLKEIQLRETEIEKRYVVNSWQTIKGEDEEMNIIRAKLKQHKKTKKDMMEEIESWINLLNCDTIDTDKGLTEIKQIFPEDIKELRKHFAQAVKSEVEEKE